MIRRLLLALLLLASLKTFGAITIAHAYNSRTVLTGLTSTTSGDGFVWVTNSTGNPSALSITGGDSFTKWGCLPTTVASENVCLWYIKNETSGSHTSITCTGCTGVNIYGGFEVSGQDTTNFLDKVVPCLSTGGACNDVAGTVTGLVYTPGFSSEAVYFQATCGGSGTTFTGTGATWTNTITSGNPGASAVTSGFGSVNAKIDGGCGGENALIVGIKGAGATQQCSFDIGYHENGTQATTGNPTVAADFTNTGNVILVAGFTVTSASSVAVSDGTDSFTEGFAGSSSSDTGQVRIDYLLNNTVAGAKTLTATITGAHTIAQIGYQELIPSAQCTPSFDVASTVGTGSSGSTANTPSITATAGATEFMYTSPGSGVHGNGVNSPWSCNDFNSTSNCQYASSQSIFGWVLSASGSSTANSTPLTGGSTWQAGAISIKLTPPASAASPSGHAVIF